MAHTPNSKWKVVKHAQRKGTLAQAGRGAVVGGRCSGIAALAQEHPHEADYLARSDVLLMCCYCVANVLLMCGECAANVLLICC